VFVRSGDAITLFHQCSSDATAVRGQPNLWTVRRFGGRQSGHWIDWSCGVFVWYACGVVGAGNQFVGASDYSDGAAFPGQLCSIAECVIFALG